MPLSDIDRRLLDRCLAHEPGAWRDFVDRYMGLIYHTIHHSAHARSMTLRPDDMEDIAAEVFLAIVDEDYKVLRQFRRSSALPTYLTVIARRVSVKELIRRRREEALGHVTASRASLADEYTDEIEPVIGPEDVQLLLKSLTEREAEVVSLYHLKFLNYRQIAKQLGIPENSVGPILSKARSGLRKAAEGRKA